MKPLRCNHWRCKSKARATIHILSWAMPLHYACRKHALPLIEQAAGGYGGPTTVVVEWAREIFNPDAPDGNAGRLVMNASKLKRGEEIPF